MFSRRLLWPLDSHDTTTVTTISRHRCRPSFGAAVEEFTKDPRVTYDMLMTSWGLTVDGRIFAMMVEGALVLKLPRARVDTLATDGQGRPFAGGRADHEEWMVAH